MAVSQGNALQQQSGPSQSSQALSSDASFHQALEQQIAEAIQPVLDEFRQQMAQGLAHEAPANGASGTSTRDAEQDTEQEHEGKQEPSATTGQAEGPGELSVKNVVPGAQRKPSGPLGGALNQALQSVEHTGGQWLQSVLVAGMSALLAESTHAAAQQRAEQGLHALLQKLFDAMPPGITNQKMQGKTERTLQVILRDALEAVFAESVRGSLQQGGQQALAQSLHGGDLGAIFSKVREIFQMMLTALVAVLRRHQQTLLRLLLAFALLALEASLVQPEQQK